MKYSSETMRRCVTTGLALALFFPSHPSLADEGVVLADTQVGGVRATGVCMIMQDPAHLGAGGVAREIVIAESDITHFLHRGFVPTRCAGKFRSRGALLHWRNRVCHAASKADEHYQQRFADHWGERAASLCGSVQQVAGEWDGSNSGEELDAE